jgi:hypothetical protein
LILGQTSLVLDSLSKVGLSVKPAKKQIQEKKDLSGNPYRFLKASYINAEKQFVSCASGGFE